jgi:phosphatidate cytidylyltransferase
VAPTHHRKWLKAALVQRALTAAVLLAGFLFALLWLPRPFFTVLVAAVVALAAVEWGRLCGLPRTAAHGFAVAMTGGFGALVWAAHSAAWTSQPWLGALFAAATLFWVAAVPAWMAYGIRARMPRRLASVGVLALLPGALAMVLLPPALVLGALALVWIADSAAYFTGRRLGRHKLAPAISPGKTWEGVAGGVVGVQVYAIICASTIPALASRLEGGAAWLLYLGGGGLLCAVSIVGDLFESAMKRQASVKDSGTLLPGHGGVLDRIDSALAVLPVVALIAFLDASS